MLVRRAAKLWVGNTGKQLRRQCQAAAQCVARLLVTRALVIARKDLTDNLRDGRSVFSALAFTLMGPAVILMVSLALGTTRPESTRAVLSAMTSIFIIVSAFVGGMNVSMDVLAGERERKSLLPLLLNGLERREIVVGKWFAVSCFSAAALALNFVAFRLVLGYGPGALAFLATLPLALLAAAAELTVSTMCRSAKEAHTYLSMLLFIPMGLGMMQVFHPRLSAGCGPFLPVLGQQIQLQSWMEASTQASVRAPGAPAVEVIAVAIASLALVAALLAASGRLLKRDDVVYGQ